MKRGGYLLERLLMPSSIDKADEIICVSESTRADAQEFKPEIEVKTSVIYEAACCVPEPATVKFQDYPFFLFVGTKEPRKNLDLCLRSWGTSKLADRGYKLVIAGGNGWNYDLPSSIREYGLENSIVDLFPDKDQLASLYAGCHALVLPSVYEGFGLPIVEAMAFGKPIITSNVSAMPEIAGDAALLISPHSEIELSKAFNELVNDQRLYEELRQNAVRRSATFSWEQAATKTLDVIRRAAGAQ